MQEQDMPRFFQALLAMGVMFSDDIVPERQKLYWSLFEDSEVTITEWEYACTEAIKRETFHKIPLPAQLMAYVEEYRSAQRQHERERAEANQRQLETAERLALAADPLWQAQERERKAELRRIQEEAEIVLARTLGPNWRDVDTHHEIPVRIAGEHLRYTPSDDPAKLRAAALAKVEQLKAQLAREQQEEQGA